MNRAIDPELGEIETMLRRRLNELADHAPATVRQPDELTVSPFTDAVPNRRRRVAGIGATIAIIAGGVGISTVAFQGASNPGGADSPEEAVREFSDALEREDVLGMIDVTVPEEVTALRAVFDDATKEVERVGILDESFSLEAVAGIDVAVPGLTLTTENLDTDLAVVTATGGTLDATFDPASFPLGSIVRDVVGDELAVSQLSHPLAGSDPSVMLATVARDGRWYVSLGFTVAEYARLATGAEFPPPVAIERVGSESPEAATLGFYERLAALDLQGAIAMMAPGEGDALLRYSPLFVPDAQAAIEGARADGLTVSISGVELQTSGVAIVARRLPSRSSSKAPSRRRGASWHTPTRRSRPSSTPWTAGMQSCPLVNKSRRRSTRSSWSPISRARSITNQTYEMPDGTIQPLEFPSSEPEGPQPFRVERRDGCTDITGPGIEKLLPGIFELGGAGRHQLLRDRRGPSSLCRAESVRWCDLLVAVRLRFPDGVAEHLGRGVRRPVVRLADRDDRWVTRRDVPVGARRCEPDRHALGPVAVPGDGSPGDGLDPRRRSRIPPECDRGRGGRRRWSRDGHPRSTGQRDPRLRERPVRGGFQQRQRQLHRSRPGRSRSQRAGVDPAPPRSAPAADVRRSRRLKSGQSEFVHRRRCSNSFCPDFGTRWRNQPGGRAGAVRVLYAWRAHASARWGVLYGFGHAGVSDVACGWRSLSSIIELNDPRRCRVTTSLVRTRPTDAPDRQRRRVRRLPRHDRAVRRLSRHHDVVPGCRAVAVVVGAQRLHDRVRRDAGAARQARRPTWPQADVPRRGRVVHGRVVAVCASRRTR